MLMRLAYCKLYSSSISRVIGHSDFAAIRVTFWHSAFV